MQTGKINTQHIAANRNMVIRVECRKVDYCAFGMMPTESVTRESIDQLILTVIEVHWAAMAAFLPFNLTLMPHHIYPDLFNICKNVK